MTTIELRPGFWVRSARAGEHGHVLYADIDGKVLVRLESGPTIESSADDLTFDNVRGTTSGWSGEVPEHGWLQCPRFTGIEGSEDPLATWYRGSGDPAYVCHQDRCPECGLAHGTHHFTCPQDEEQTA